MSNLQINSCAQSCKKQNFVALFTNEANYIVVGRHVTQVLQLKLKYEDYRHKLEHIPINCDNTNSISFKKIQFNTHVPNIGDQTSLYQRSCSKR